MINVIALKDFRKTAKKLFSEAEILTLMEFMSKQPEKGDVIPATQGLRKLRWTLENRGKRGGSRIIYYYHRSEWQVLLLSAYAKSEKEDLSEREKKILMALVKEILEQE